MSKYQVTTDQGTYEIETADPPALGNMLQNKANSEADIQVAQDNVNHPISNAINQTTNRFADSGKRVIDNTINTIEHPLRTIGQVGAVGMGAIEKYSPQAIVMKHLAGVPNAQLPQEQAFDSAVQGVKDRYGSLQNVGNTIQNDPVGFAMDAASLASVPAMLKGGSIVAGKTAQMGGKVAQAFNFDQKGMDLATRLRAAAAAAHKSEIDKFGDALDVEAKANPSQTISIQQVVDDIKNNPDLPYNAERAFKSTPVLRDMLKNTNDPGYISPASVSLQDVQKIINHINTKIPNNIKANSLDILDAQNDIRAAQLQAFPNMENIRAEYAQHANDYKLLKKYFKPGATVDAIKSNFSGNVEAKFAAQRLFDNSDILKDASKYRGQIATVNFLKRLITLGVAKEGGWKLIQK